MQIRRGKGLSFARRIYLPRMLGVGVGCLSVIAALYPASPPVWVWLLLALNVLAWPHLAYQLASRSVTPYRTEHRNILVDSLMGGFWAAAIQFNPLPTAMMLGLMAMHNVAAGGTGMLFKGLAAQGLGIVLAWLWLGPAFEPQTTQLQIYACLPVLLLYPMVIGMESFRVATQLAEHKRSLSALSRTDSLTGLLNHGSWKDLLHLKFHKCRQSQAKAVIALIDIDHFKNINDSYGHLVGDSVLRELSRDLRSNLREHDLAGRYGGDEFCVILPGMDLDRACEVMDRLRQRFSNYRHADVAQLRVSLSIGLAAYHKDFQNARNWLNEADKALYAAKNGGRDRISSASAEVIELAPGNLANSA